MFSYTSGWKADALTGPAAKTKQNKLTRQQFTWLLEGLSIEQPKAIAMWRTHWKKYISQVARENRSLVSFRNYIALGKTQDVSANKGVSLLTAHMSKGLQYEIVYVIGLNEGTFPDYRAIINGGKALEQEKIICLLPLQEQKEFVI